MDFIFRAYWKKVSVVGTCKHLAYLDVDFACIAIGFVVLKYRSSPKKIVFTLSICDGIEHSQFAVLEAIISWCLPEHVQPIFTIATHNKMELRVNLRGVFAVALNTTNRWDCAEMSLRNAGRFLTVVVIGGSTAQCYYLDDHKTWPYLLQEKMKLISPKLGL